MAYNSITTWKPYIFRGTATTFERYKVFLLKMKGKE